ncbi:MAG: cytochrome c family protein [Rhodospirillaceae bacterium]|jgi:cytochrome c|nr:cytochrome c family protein [Rhodospirillaceae bacterium]
MKGFVTASLAVFVSCLVFSSPGTTQDYDRATLGAGKIMYMRCISCHTITKNGRNLVGPNLWGVVGAIAGTRDGFKGYSEALKTSEIVWSRETLEEYIKDPAVFLPGTNMIYKGLPKEKDRAALLAYLETESANENAEHESFRY